MEDSKDLNCGVRYIGGSSNTAIKVEAKQQ
jgi:hypothetical protein